ncbi:MAG: MarR family EPS-associated transcriptional regulator [Deltaproteobacteria bacterium]|nr:MarR family EPS-associated transcriptional regulator [Deltaproteobacteria bacterium]
MLEALFAEPSLSQRQLAREVGLPLSKAHFVLRRLIEKGLVKVQNVRDSKHKMGYLYVLTPRGLEAKAKLTYRFLQRTAADYQSMRDRVEKILGAAILAARTSSNGSVAVCLLGGGPLGEVVIDVIALRQDAVIVTDVDLARVAVLIDPDASRPRHSNLTLVDFA